MKMKDVLLALAVLLPGGGNFALGVAPVADVAPESPRLKAERLGYAPAAPGWEWVENPTGQYGLGLHRVDPTAGSVATIGGSLAAPTAPQSVTDRAAEIANPYSPYYAPPCPNGRCPLKR